MFHRLQEELSGSADLRSAWQTQSGFNVTAERPENVCDREP